MKYKIIVDKQSRTNPSEDKRVYEIDIEELRCKGDVYDSLIITKDEDYILRKLYLTEYCVLKKLDEPIKQPISDINIELFEGDNYIYLIDMVGNKLYAEYLIKNDFNDTYITKSEAYSAITETAKSVTISVNQLLTDNYSTTKETQAIIEALSSAITLELKKKVNDEDLTGASIVLRLNDDTSEAKINADKISLEGKEINLTSDNITIKSANFSADENGKVNCKNLNATGGKIGGWNIVEHELNNGAVFIRDDGSSTVYTVADLIIMRGYIMEIEGFELSPAMIQHYDLNGDGQVTSLDYMKLQDMIGISMN
ncbi:MAG: hypothetical protein HFJ52_00095 [Clostridia bacterium]|nr:hypothetical protein [Clostridia bacterium]